MPPSPAIATTLQPLARELQSLICAGGEDFLKGRSWAAAVNGPVDATHYLRAVHRGFTAAQEILFDRLVALHSTPSGARTPTQLGEVLLLRKFADTIAWQILDRQLYLARQLYRGQTPVSLVAGNAPSLLEAARSISAEPHDSFALIADLTSFVQVGDLLAMQPSQGGLTLAEVKEGEVNTRLLDLLEDGTSGYTAAALTEIKQKYGHKGIEQAERILRQKARMKGVADAVNTGLGVEPASSLPLVVGEIKDPPLTWDHTLDRLIKDSEGPGWAIDVVDDVLFVGAYRGQMRLAATRIFRGWLDGVGIHPETPIIPLSLSLIHPLALPPFARSIDFDSAMAIAFGQCHVLMAVSIDNLISMANNHGLALRWSTRKEKGRFNIKGVHPVTRGRHILLADHKGALIAIQDGLLMRMEFHGLSPLGALPFLSDPGPSPISSGA